MDWSKYTQKKSKYLISKYRDIQNTPVFTILISILLYPIYIKIIPIPKRVILNNKNAKS